MRNTTKSNKIIQSILSNPKRMYPSLSNEEIRTLLIESIKRYLARKMTLDALTTVAQKIIKNEQSLPHSLNSILDEIQSFSVIRTILNDFIKELMEDEKKVTITIEKLHRNIRNNLL